MTHVKNAKWMVKIVNSNLVLLYKQVVRRAIKSGRTETDGIRTNNLKWTIEAYLRAHFTVEVRLSCSLNMEEDETKVTLKFVREITSCLKIHMQT